ncbi:MAG: hypothetical protein FJX31_01830 [Alphaproteobacteria bacterium]|nr:hypothetical protein [Alphaproteobacteria bacterium]
MFKLARGIACHTIDFIAVIAFAVVMFSGGEEERAKLSSPWAKGAQVQAEAASSSADDDSISGKIGEYANVAGEYTSETSLSEKELNPVKMGEETFGRFDEANSAFVKANDNGE